MQVKVCEPEEGFVANVRKGEAWCPYCATVVSFGWDSSLKIARCTTCGCTVRDFYIRKFNDLWAESSLIAFIRTVKKSRVKVNS